MTSSKIVRSAVAAAALLACTGVFATDTQTLNVTATVDGVCKLVSVPSMDFSLDPSAGGDVTTPVTVTYRCTLGTPAPTVKLGASGGIASPYNNTTSSGAANLVGSGTAAGESIPYEITWVNPTLAGTGFGATAQSFILSGKILGTDYENVKAGPYAGTVAVNITP